MIVLRTRILKAYETAMHIDPDREAAIEVVASIFGLDHESVREVITQHEEESPC